MTAVPKAYSSAPSRAATSTSRAVAQAAIGAKADAIAQAAEQEDLLGFGEMPSSQGLPAYLMEERRRPGASGSFPEMTMIVGVGLGDAGGDGADAGFPRPA
jgi:hypothetical protein